MRRMLRVAPLTIVVVVVIAAASVTGFFFFKHNADQQEHTLLEADASQAALYVGSTFSGVGSILDSLASVVSLSDGSPSVFAAHAKAFAQGPLNLVLAERQGGAYQVVSAVGTRYHAGQTLSPATSATLARADATLTPAPVVFNGKTSLAHFALGPPLVPTGFAVFMEFSFNPFIASQVTAAKPFELLKVALYGAPKANKANLLVATVPLRDLPKGAGTVTALSTVGNAKWVLVAEARSPLVGSFARQAPYIILGLGLFVALLVAVTVEVLERRQRYAARLVDERTADLRTTLGDLRIAQDALVRGERLRALGEMASVVGHELRNPLAAVTNALYLLRAKLGDPADPALEKHLSMVERETAKAAALAEDLTAFVRPREPQKAEVELPDLVTEVVEATPAPANVVLEVDTEPMVIQADRRQLAEVLTNLVSNAYAAVSDGGTVRVAAHRRGQEAELSVEDSGPGIDPGLSERVFEPFFTTKHDGTGLGLAIVRRLVEAHGGRVAFENGFDDHGVRVIVRLPAEMVEVPS
jgi:signal transduction histidine kinase